LNLKPQQDILSIKRLGL